MIAVRDCMGVNKEEKVAVITDTGKIDIAQSFLFALHALGVDATFFLMIPRSHHAEEPPPEVGVAMASVDVALLVTTASFEPHLCPSCESNKRCRAEPVCRVSLKICLHCAGDLLIAEKVSELSWKLTPASLETH